MKEYNAWFIGAMAMMILGFIEGNGSWIFVLLELGCGSMMLYNMGRDK